MSYPQRIYVLPARRAVQYAPPPPKQSMKRSRPTEAIVAQLLGDEMGPSGPRKRERLTHLTTEEKMERRKMKNRVAAQNARDKKKERSTKIEDVMRDLVEENRRLRAENEKLRRANQDLLLQHHQESDQYYQHNDENESNIYQNVVYEEEVVDTASDRAFESAAFISAPQQRDKARSTARRTTSGKKTISMDTYLTIVSILCNHMDRMVKQTTSTESSKILKAQMESSIASLQSTLRKDVTATHRPLQAALQDSHLQKHVKHFRRVP